MASVGKADGRIRYQTIAGGEYAVTRYVGPYGPTMLAAYQRIFQRLQKLIDYHIIGLPLIELYQTTQIKPELALNHTDVLIPVQKKE